ncbi:tRNA:m(4)X modification enzyme TRM13 homolog isoform X2 [Photinus pyralis]|uniref:tRNA:m(4)X modification enzyme TRM13 homolog isoform X2 n=1 Tax=Photinus pyralis TaxID=7054 RepID=UPI0012674A9D|nr:tRNA:m(4)X modification enzyme TRM13 homolog isoform X2 [Photinus pyralis]
MSCYLSSTCYASKLKKHLKKCNAKPSQDVPYLQKNVNVEVESTSQTRSLANMPVPQLLEVIAKVNKIHKDIQNSIQEKLATHSVLDEELGNPAYGPATKKHLVQVSSILGLLQEYNLLQDDTCFVELGAGKGKVSYWLAKTLELLRHSSSSVLLVERASLRHKHDNKLDKTDVSVVRIRADIADLLLPEIDTIAKAKHVVGVTKHLCGDATDLALTCLMNCQSSGKDVTGMVMTFCCLHRCHWNTYVGKHFFEHVGINSVDFDIMCGLVSWAVCGSGQSREKRKNDESGLGENERYTQIGLNRCEKETVGKKCKDLINWGRKIYLQNQGFNCDLCYYVNSNITLENVCIIAMKANKEV